MRKLALFLVLASLPCTTFAQSGMWGSRSISRSFVIQGNLLFDADGRGVTVYDISAPAIREVTSVHTDDESRDLALLDSHDLLLLTSAGFQHYAIGDDGSLILTSEIPAPGFQKLAWDGTWLASSNSEGITVWQPAGASFPEVAQLPTTATVDSMAWSGGHLYAGIHDQGIQVFDPTSSTMPVNFVPAIGNGLAVAGTTLYAASGVDGLTAIDVSNPDQPTVISRTGAGDVNLVRVAVGGTRAYAAQDPGLLYAYDLAGSAPALLMTLHDSAEVLAATSSRVYIGSEHRYALDGSLLPGLPVTGYVLDRSPALVGSTTTPATAVSGVATGGSLAYVSDGDYFRVIDVSTTVAPREIGSLQLPTNDDEHVKLQGNLAVVYGSGPVDIIDVSNPYQPRLIGIFQSLGVRPSTAAIARDTVVEGNPFTGFHVLDYEHYLPTIAQISGVKGHYYEIVARNDAAYVFQMNALYVVDLTDRMNAVLGFTAPLGVRSADIVNATDAHPDLLVVYAGDGVHVFSLANPLAPVDLGVTPLALDGLMAASNDSALFALDGTISRLDLADPRHPALAPTAMRVTAPEQMASANGKVVVADRYSLRIYGPDTAAPPPPPPVLPVRRRLTE